MTSSNGFDGSKVTFVHQVPLYAMTDDDVLWALEHERCHTEVQPEGRISIPRGTSDEIKRRLDFLYGLRSVEEVRCYNHILRAEQMGKFRISQRSYNNAISTYREVFSEMLLDISGNDLASRLFREYVDKNFINPYQLQFR